MAVAALNTQQDVGERRSQRHRVAGQTGQQSGGSAGSGQQP
jgi:hypothetical protein